MAISRIARIHLVYQFIILTLLVFCIGYNEILPDKKYLFLALIPVFCYQLMIVFCCSEIVPLPGWMALTDISTDDIIKEESKITDLTVSESPVNLNIQKPSSTTQSTTITESISPRQHLSCKRDFKTTKIISEEKTEPHISSETSNQVEKIRKGHIFTKANSGHVEMESMKSYCFPYRQKRLEKWVETKENVRPYKLRSSKSVVEYKSSKSLPNRRSPSLKMDRNDINIRLETPENFNETKHTELSDFTKSYSYPFRQRKVEKSQELDESDLNIPSMPSWKNLSYCKNIDRKPRKSLSTEAIDNELKFIKSRCEPNRNDFFSQSVELPGPIDSNLYVSKKNVLKPVTSFNKFKQGIVSCFNRNKKENLKSDDAKQTVENKRPFFKDLFLSKENLISESDKKEDFALKTRSPSFTNPGNKKRINNLSPSYASYVNDSFGDVKASSYQTFDKL